jgi:hypothetical protein
MAWFDSDGNRLSTSGGRTAYFEALFVAQYEALQASGVIPRW